MRHGPSELPRLTAHDGALRLPSGIPLRLLGCVSASAPEPATPSSGLLQREADPGWLAGIPAGQRCIGIPLTLARHCSGDALRALDERIRQHARRGSYTLLIVAARLWLAGPRLLQLAQRYAARPEVQLALSGRAPLAPRVWATACALRRAHPESVVWLPLECAQAAATHPAQPGIGWLWDAAAPQNPGAAMRTAARYPVLLYRWRPLAHSALSQNRLMALCRAAGIGWLAQAPEHEAAATRLASQGGDAELRLRLAVHASCDPAPAPRRRAPISEPHLTHWESHA